MTEGIRDVSDRPLSELQSLHGRVAVVTGGARGIGYAIVRRLAGFPVTRSNSTPLRP